MHQKYTKIWGQSPQKRRPYEIKKTAALKLNSCLALYCVQLSYLRRLPTWAYQSTACTFDILEVIRHVEHRLPRIRPATRPTGMRQLQSVQSMQLLLQSIYAFLGDTHALRQVEILETWCVLGQGFEALVGDFVAAADVQVVKTWQVLGESDDARVGDLCLERMDRRIGKYKDLMALRLQIHGFV